MKNLYHKLSLFSVLALVAFKPHNLQATSNSPTETASSERPIKSLTSRSSDLLQDTLQKLKNDQYIPDSSFEHLMYTSFQEIKQLRSTMTPDHDMFDVWIRLILSTFPKRPDFEDVLKVAKLKGESEAATPMDQDNLGRMYEFGVGVNTDLPKAIEFYQKAADQGYAQSQHKFGILHEFGEGVAKDWTKAIEFYQKAADQGYARSQYELGLKYQLGEGVDKDLFKAFEFYQKAAKQGHIESQGYLGSMYYNGQGVGIDLAQSLNWSLKSYKNRSINPLVKHRIQNLVNYTPITLSLNDEKHHLKNQETLKNNIEAFLGRHGLEKLINTSYESEKGTNELTSSFKESKFAIPSLVKKYQKIVNFEDILLKSIPAFDQLGFMVTCLQPDDIEAFKSSNCPDIKYYELQGESFLTFGQNNVEAADKWMTIFKKSQPVYDTIYDVLSVIKEIRKNFQTEIEMSDVAQALKTQYEFRLKLDLDKTLESDKTNDLTLNKKLIEKVEQDIEVLKQLQGIPQQLIDLLIESAPVRNRLFLQNNDYIEPIFKD